MTYQVTKNGEVASTHANRQSAVNWISMMAGAGMTGYEIVPPKTGNPNLLVDNGVRLTVKEAIEQAETLSDDFYDETVAVWIYPVFMQSPSGDTYQVYIEEMVEGTFYTFWMSHDEEHDTLKEAEEWLWRELENCGDPINP